MHAASSSKASSDQSNPLGSEGRGAAIHSDHLTLPRSRRGHLSGGQPIGQLMHQALEYPHLISLAAGFVDDGTLPIELTSEAMQGFQNDPGRLRKALQYGSNAGDYALRQAILDFSFRDFPPVRSISPDQVILTAGSNQLLHLIADSLFDSGDIVLTAAPTYFVFLGALKGMGIRTIGVESDEQGMCPKALAETMQRLEQQGLASRVKAVYLVPYFDNPAGTTIGDARRIEIADILQRWRALGRDTILLADYAYQELGFEATKVAPWRSLIEHADEFTVELGTFSKSFSPGVRIGWGIFPPAMTEVIAAMKANIDFGSPHFNQQLMLSVLQCGRLPEHLDRLRHGYHAKGKAMVEACREFLGPIPGLRWYEPQGGLYVWVEMPPTLPAGVGTPLYQAAIDQGVLYVPGEYCFPDEGTSKHFSSMRLTFGVQSPERIRQGVRLLGDAMQSLLQSS
ncbi:MAG: PLP-dependent aminotransferase family protein [Pirellulales bacterium]